MLPAGPPQVPYASPGQMHHRAGHTQYRHEWVSCAPTDLPRQNRQTAAFGPGTVADSLLP